MREYHKQIDKRMFDFPGFYLDMIQQLPNPAVIAEVGVAEGASAIYLAEALLNEGRAFTFYLIDNLAYGQDLQLRTLMKNIGNANLAQHFEIVPVSSVEGACRFPDRHFDFVFIDASHKFEWTKADILLWYQKIKQGGILAGHDYNQQEGMEVWEAVDLMIPRNHLEVIPTAQHYNIWKITKSDCLQLRTF